MQDKRPEAIEEILKICRGLLDDRIPLIDGCRQLALLRHEVDPGQSAAFDTFIAVDSETDHLPLGEVRQYCSPTWLEKADEQVAHAERLYREPVREAAEALLRTLSVEGGDS
jgi:Protein of unknown function (DUF2489)